MERLKFALNVLLMVTGFPLLLSANLTHPDHGRNAAIGKEKKTGTHKIAAPPNAVTDGVSFIIRYPGLVI